MRVVAINWDMLGKMVINIVKKLAIGIGKSWDMSGQLNAIRRAEATGKSKTRGREKLGHEWATKRDT